MSDVLDTNLERLNKIRERIAYKLKFFSPDIPRDNLSVIVTYKEYLFLDALARDSASLLARNNHLEYRSNDNVWNDFKKSQEIWEMERKLLVEQNKRLKEELEQLKKEKGV